MRNSYLALLVGMIGWGVVASAEPMTPEERAAFLVGKTFVEEEAGPLSVTFDRYLGARKITVTYKNEKEPSTATHYAVMTDSVTFDLFEKGQENGQDKKIDSFEVGKLSKNENRLVLVRLRDARYFPHGPYEVQVESSVKSTPKFPIPIYTAMDLHAFVVSQELRNGTRCQKQFGVAAVRRVGSAKIVTVPLEGGETVYNITTTVRCEDSLFP